MGTATGVFVNSTQNYAITITGDSITTASFQIEGDVVTQTGNQTRTVLDVFAPIRATQLRFNVRESGSLFSELGGLGLQDAVVELVDTDTDEVKFTGYVQPSNIERNQYWSSGLYTITCTDGLAQLENKAYELSGFITLSEFFRTILNTIGTTSQALYIASWQDAEMASTAPNLIRFDSGLIDATNELEALRVVLRRFNLILSQSNKRGVIEWRIVERKVIGLNQSGWVINFANGNVTSQAQDDSVSIADADLFAEHIRGKTDAIQRVETRFDWNVEDPLVLNNSFQQWNEALNKPTDWDILSGTVVRDTAPSSGLVYSARSTDNARIKQRLNYIKPAGAQFDLTFAVQPIWTGSRLVDKTISYGIVSFIDPAGEQPTLYLANDGSVSETETVLTYDVDFPDGVAQFIATPSITLQAGNNAFGSNRIVDVELFFSRVDQDLNTIFSAVEWQSVKTSLEAIERPNQLLTRADSGQLGQALSLEFPIGEQTIYNAKGAIEVNDGTNWVVARDWGASETFEVVYVRSISAQTKSPLTYYKLSLTPASFIDQSSLDGFTYDGALYTPNYQLVNYTKKNADYQLIALTNLTPSDVTQIIQSVGDGTVIFDKIPITPTSLAISEIRGSVDFAYPKPRANQFPQVKVSWSDIEVFLTNGSSFTVADGFEQFNTGSEPRVFYYDRESNLIASQFRTVWLFSSGFRNTLRYTKLFTTYENNNVDREGQELDPTDPVVVPDIEPIAKDLFAPKIANREAVITETIFDYQTDAIAKLGEDIDADVTSLVVDTSYPVRVTLAQGDRITLHSGTKNYDLVVSAKTIAGSLTIPVQNRYVLAYQGAKIKYSQASTGSQLLIQPDKVLIVAQNADGNASSALNLIAGQGVAIAELSAEVLGANGLGNSAGIKFEVNEIGARAVLKVDGGGNIASINLLSGEEDSSVKINADKIDVNGEATFFAGITEAIRLGQIEVPTGNVAIRATRANEPVTREDNSPLQPNDLWFVTDEGNLPNIYNGSAWVRAYTVINGGDITTGTVSAQVIDVEGLFALNITITDGSLRAIDSEDSGNYVQLSSSGLVGFQGGTKRFEVPVVGTPMFTGNINNTVVDLQTSELRTSETATTTGGVIVDGSGIRAYNTAGDLTVNISNNGNASFTGTVIANSGSLGDLTIGGTLDLRTSGKITFGNTLEISKDNIKYANVFLNNLGVVVGNSRLFTNGLLVGTTTQFGLGECNLTNSSLQIVRMANLSGKMTLQSDNGISVNGTNTFTGNVSNPTSITVVNGFITAIS